MQYSILFNHYLYFEPSGTIFSSSTAKKYLFKCNTCKVNVNTEIIYCHLLSFVVLFTLKSLHSASFCSFLEFFCSRCYETFIRRFMSPCGAFTSLCATLFPCVWLPSKASWAQHVHTDTPVKRLNWTPQETWEALDVRIVCGDTHTAHRPAAVRRE